MSRNDCAVFKVFLKHNEITEVKKFVVDGDTSVITSFLYMKEKLQSLFPKLRDNNFRITWRDTEGDDILIENDEDLILAFTEMDGPVKALYVTVSPGYYPGNAPQFTNAPTRIICDVCNKEITTYRYKCLQCFDYDLCIDCEHAGHHSHHMMLRTSTPELPFARCGRKLFEHVSKAVKKANYTAYKDCKRKSKWEHKKKCDQGDCSGAGPSTKDVPDQGCPFQDYMPHLYPFMNAVGNAASQAATAAANMANNTATAAAAAAAETTAPPQQPEPSTQTKSAPQSGEEQNPTFQFLEAIRTALSAFALPQQTQSSNIPPTNQTPQPEASPAASEAGIDLTKSPSADEPMETCGAPREPGWTILTNEGQIPSPFYPVLTPTVVAPPQPNQTQVPQQFQVPQATQVPQAPQATQPPQVPQAPQAPQAPQEPPTSQIPTQPSFFAQSIPREQISEPNIAVGLTQLMEMGFQDAQALVALLRRYNGNVDEVIKHIFENK